jgi:hypothetical protein
MMMLPATAPGRLGPPVLAGSTKNETKTNNVIAKNSTTDESNLAMTYRVIDEA